MAAPIQAASGGRRWEQVALVPFPERRIILTGDVPWRTDYHPPAGESIWVHPAWDMLWVLKGLVNRSDHLLHLIAPCACKSPGVASHWGPHGEVADKHTHLGEFTSSVDAWRGLFEKYDPHGVIFYNPHKGQEMMQVTRFPPALLIASWASPGNIRQALDRFVRQVLQELYPKG